MMLTFWTMDWHTCRRRNSSPPKKGKTIHFLYDADYLYASTKRERSICLTSVCSCMASSCKYFPLHLVCLTAIHKDHLLFLYRRRRYIVPCCKKAAMKVVRLARCSTVLAWHTHQQLIWFIIDVCISAQHGIVGLHACDRSSGMLTFIPPNEAISLRADCCPNQQLMCLPRQGNIVSELLFPYSLGTSFTPHHPTSLQLGLIIVDKYPPPPLSVTNPDHNHIRYSFFCGNIGTPFVGQSWCISNPQPIYLPLICVDFYIRLGHVPVPWETGDRFW